MSQVKVEDDIPAWLKCWIVIGSNTYNTWEFIQSICLLCTLFYIPFNDATKTMQFWLWIKIDDTFIDDCISVMVLLDIPYNFIV